MLAKDHETRAKIIHYEDEPMNCYNLKEYVKQRVNRSCRCSRLTVKQCMTLNGCIAYIVISFMHFIWLIGRCSVWITTLDKANSVPPNYKTTDHVLIMALTLSGCFVWPLVDVLYVLAWLILLLIETIASISV